MQAARKEARGGRDLKDELGRMKYEGKPVRRSLHVSAFIVSFLRA
jgi:hypothetical protein